MREMYEFPQIEFNYTLDEHKHNPILTKDQSILSTQ